ncbi:AraC family transcriptional regulator [Pontibacter sp. G13]|uniref:AraC family transcriptional regulator n=1 Tax=Pontibacter sp. G13 TaxID=3074898 RepID=UPI00288983DF|nr:AraC family transcriptional regulator [Pontibacter sp. G13]WNJ18465.1 AraC family transcriptional regulator [Pontibacter sp. G13]
MKLPSGTYFGDRAEALSVGRYQLTWHRYPPKERLPAHVHTHPYLSVAVSGKYQECFSANKEMQVNPMQVLLRPSGYRHANTFGKEAGWCFNLDWEGKFPDWMPELFSLDQPKNWEVSPWELTLLMHASIMDFAEDELNLLADEAMIGLGKYAHTNRYTEKVTSMLEYLHGRYAEPCSLEEMGLTLKVHPVYLSRIFKRVMGMTIGQYLRRLRITKSWGDLWGNESLTGIAHDRGFCDQAHYSKTFKNLLGQTPSQARKKMRKLE